MDRFSADELNTLLQAPVGVCLSLFMPTQRADSDIRQGPIRLENLIRDATQRLCDRGLPHAAIQALLDPIQPLPADRRFWQHQREGLAIYVAPEIARIYQLPCACEELVVVNEHFYIAPLIPLLHGDGRMYLLTLSKNGVKLWQGTRDSLNQIELHGVPASLDEALKYDDFEKQFQLHTGIPGRGGERSAIFHGQGARVDIVKDQILRYFQQIDNGVRAALRDEHTPLVLAGVDYLLPLYRAVNTYPYLIDGGVTANPKDLSEAELHQRAWTLVQPIFQQAQQEAIARYQRYLRTQPHLVSSAIRTIIPATYHSRVDTLFVACGFRQWGTYEPTTNAVQIHTIEQRDDTDLLNYAAFQTLLHGGTVYAVPPEQMPNTLPVAAILRY